jgi:hypothetical protein
MQLKGRTVHLNAQSKFGEIRVELLDAKDKVVAQSKPIQDEQPDIPVKWTVAVTAWSEPVKMRINSRTRASIACWCSREA